MDYREALLKLNENDLRFAYSQVLQEEPAKEMHQIELIESIRQGVLNDTYLTEVLTYLPDEEYDFYLRAVKAGHEYIPMRAERLPQTLSRLLIFDSSNGLLLPTDVIDHIKSLDIKAIEDEREVVKKHATFITGVMFLYGAVHEELIASLYKRFFEEDLSVNRLDFWIEMLGIKRINDMVMVPEIFDGLNDMNTPKYIEAAYYQPASFEELSKYSGPTHHRDSEEMQDFLQFIDEHAAHIDPDKREELKEVMIFLLISMTDPNAVMETMINIYAHQLEEEEFHAFDQKFQKVMNTTRLWMFKGKTKEEADVEFHQQEALEELEKEKKVIDFNIFRNE